MILQETQSNEEDENDKGDENDEEEDDSNREVEDNTVTSSTVSHLNDLSQSYLIFILNHYEQIKIFRYS